MRILGTAFAFLLAAGVAFAQQQPSSESGQMPDTGKHSDKAKGEWKGGKAFRAEVVSTDAQAKTITVKREGASSSSTSGTSGTSGTSSSMSNEMTLSVDPSVESMLSSYSAGDHVKIVTKKDSSGKEIVSKIERADNRPASDQPPKP